MLDPAAIEVMRTLSRPLPFMVESEGEIADVDALTPSRLRDRRALQIEMRTAAAGWIDAAENLVAVFSEALREEALAPSDLKWLRSTLAEFEASFDADAKWCRKLQTEAKRWQARARANPSPEVVEMAEIASGFLAEAARHGRFKMELFFALGSIEAQTHPDAGRGPAFSNPDDLVAFLRGAIA